MNDYGNFRSEHDNIMSEIISERINQTKRELEIEILRTAEVKKPEFKGSFYLIYSPRIVKIRPCDSTKLNLGIKINLPDRREAGFGLLPSIVSSNLTIENFQRITKNKTKGGFVELHLLNRNFHNTIKMKKDQAFVYMILIKDIEDDTIINKHKRNLSGSKGIE